MPLHAVPVDVCIQRIQNRAHGGRLGMHNLLSISELPALALPAQKA